MKTTLSMKKLSLFIVSVVILSACNPLNKMAKYAESVKYEVNPSPIEMHGDSVELNMTGKFPPEYFHKLVSVVATPSLVNEAGESVKQFKTVKFIGTDVEGDGQKVDFTKGGTVTYNDKVAYSDNMEMGKLVLKVEAAFKSKKKELGSFDIGYGTVITPKLVKADEKPILGKDKFNRITPKSIDGQINFLINSASVRSTELRGDDIKAMKDFIAEGVEKEWNFKGVSSSAYASPDGELSLNENLADDRAKTASKAIGQMLSRKKVEAAKAEGFFKNEGKGEDWDGFKSAMTKSDIKDKDLIIRILEMYPDVNKREQEIKNLAETYLVVKDDILPTLRRSQLTINAEEVGYSDEEIKQLASSNPSELNVEELLYAATLTDKEDEKMKIYKTAKAQFAQDWRGPNNVGYMLMLQNKISDAKAEFDAAAKLDNNSIVNNNLGIIAKLSGDLDKAKEHYAKASGAGPEVGYNLGIINIMEGDYDDAKSNFGSTKSFNAALAVLLAGDNEAAISNVEASDEKEEALAYYLKAVAGARSGNKELVINNLKSAFAKDNNLKAKAKRDAEFLDMKSDSDFQGLVN